MYDMKPLEEEWLKYQTKKRKPWYLFFIFLILSLILIFLFINKSDIKLNRFSKFFNTISMFNEEKLSSLEKDDAQFTLINTALTRLEIDKLHETPSLKDDTSNVATSTDLLVDIPILDEQNEKLISKNDDIHRKKVYLDIIETTSLSAYEDVEKRFHQSHDIDDALFLAKSYYKKGNYSKAEQWAFEANKLDANLEDSFLVFVKSKMKLGQKNEVISILNQYLKHNNSENVRALLNKIENNKFE